MDNAGRPVARRRLGSQCGFSVRRPPSTTASIRCVAAPATMKATGRKPGGLFHLRLGDLNLLISGDLAAGGNLTIVRSRHVPAKCGSGIVRIAVRASGPDGRAPWLARSRRGGHDERVRCQVEGARRCGHRSGRIGRRRRLSVGQRPGSSTHTTSVSPNGRYKAFVHQEASVDHPDDHLYLGPSGGRARRLMDLAPDSDWCRTIIWTSDSRRSASSFETSGWPSSIPLRVSCWRSCKSSWRTGIPAARERGTSPCSRTAPSRSSASSGPPRAGNRNGSDPG